MVKKIIFDTLDDDWLTVVADDGTLLFSNHSMNTLDVIRLLRALGHTVQVVEKTAE